jgi:hypothetical protein
MDKENVLQSFKILVPLNKRNINARLYNSFILGKVPSSNILYSDFLGRIADKTTRISLKTKIDDRGITWYFDTYGRKYPSEIVYSIDTLSTDIDSLEVLEDLRDACRYIIPYYKKMLDPKFNDNHSIIDVVARYNRLTSTFQKIINDMSLLNSTYSIMLISQYDISLVNNAVAKYYEEV